MERIEFSGGAAKVAQAVAIFLATPFLVWIACFILRNDMELISLIILLAIIAGDVFILKFAISNADIYLFDNRLEIEKIFSKQIRLISDVERVDDTLNPTLYYILFKDGIKVYFTLKSSSLKKRIYADRTTILNDLRNQLKLETLPKGDDI